MASVGTLASGAQPAAETSVRCELKPEAVNPMDSAVYWARQYIDAVPTRPSEATYVPEGLPKDSQYFLLNIAGRKIPLILASGEDARTAVLYADTNGDGWLSNEKSYKCEPAKSVRSNWNKFGPVTFQLGSGEQKAKVELGFMWLAPTYLGVYPPNLHKGQFRLAGDQYTVAIIDGDMDGTYGKVFSVPPAGVTRPECDFLMIDLNHDGKFPNWTYFQQSEVMPLGKFVKLAGSYYSVNVAADGTAVELKKTEPALGTLDLGGADVQLKLWSDAGEQDLAGAEKLWKLPAGTYWAVAARLHLADSTGEKWTFYNYRETGSLRNFQVRADETTTFKLGTPFQIKTSARRSGKETVSIGVLLEGQAGDLYSLAVTRNAKSVVKAQTPTGNTVAEPKFQIVSDTGKVLASGQFEYG